MIIHVKLSTTLRCHVRGYQAASGLHLEADGTQTAKSIAETLNLPLKEIKIIMVNGVHASPDTVLSDGDRVAFFPAVGGG